MIANQELIQAIAREVLARIEAADNTDFDTYLARYLAD